MAEAALFGIAKSVLKQLASPALDEFRLLWCHKEQLKKLEDTIITILNVLQDADRRQFTDAAVKEWLVRLRIVLYEADDLFDAISAKVLLKKDKKGTKIGRKVRHFLWKPYHFAFLVKNAHKVKEIRERFDDIARDLKGFNFLPSQTNLDPIFRIRTRKEPTHSFVLRNEVVGREREKEDLVRMLLHDYSREQRGVSVIAVIGIGGLGKTALARLVYNDERVKQGFDLRLWTCINYFSNLKQVLITLLKSASTLRELENLDQEQLESLFKAEIKGKRFFIVLDDVWDENPQNWWRLEQLLSNGRDGSNILTTTRSEIVARSLRAYNPYFLKELSDESARLLFKKVAFEEEGYHYSSEFEHLGRQIVRRCANIPLAIITIASLLREKEKERWYSLLHDEISEVFPGAFEEITHILQISYKELPYPVKCCFWYCSLFPKHYEFEKDSLILLWIAQGFVEHEPLVYQSLEDRAEEYFFYLVNRCFFQLAVGYRETTSIATYKMQDMMHDLAMTVAGSECILVDQTPHSSWGKNVHHLSINCESDSMVDNVCSFSHSKSLRTFLHPCGISFRKNSVKKLLLCFKSLRVLDLSDLKIEKVPTSIGKLIHLRFLDLSGNHMEILPSSICKLPYLQSLILGRCEFLKEFPEDFGDLLSLRHLMLQDCNNMVKMPPGLAALTSLVTLDKIVVHNPSGGLQYLEGLDNLTGSLQIVLPSAQWENATTDAKRSSLSRKSRLSALDIIHDSRGQREPDTANTGMIALEPPPNLVDLSIKYFGGKQMPHWVMCLHKLVILKLEGCSNFVELPPLSHPPSLKELYISDMPSMLTIEDIKFYEPDWFFPSLETLSIEKMPNLKSWWLQAPTMLPTFPCLTRVSICDCPKLIGCMPLFSLAEELKLEKVREEIILQAIGSEAISSTSHGNPQSMHLGQQAKVRRIHWSRIRHLEIPTVNRNLLKGLKYLASLEKLIIQNFNQELQEEEKEEEGLPWKHLQKLGSMRLVFGETFSMRTNQHLLHGFECLTSLKELTLGKCKELYLSWRLLLHLDHLQIVRIEEVEQVIDTDSDPMMMQTQSISRSIRELMIEGGSGEWVHDIPWKSFPFMKTVELWRIRNLEALPEGIQHLPDLENLSIGYIKGVVSLPDWMSSLLSLSYLRIYGISKELEMRCKEGTGEDWPKIQHIKEIRIL